jgi:hypothetical protein
LHLTALHLAALHLAACFGYEAVVQLLLEGRAYDAAQGSLVWARGGDAAAEHGYQISTIMQTSPLTLSHFHALCGNCVLRDADREVTYSPQRREVLELDNQYLIGRNALTISQSRCLKNIYAKEPNSTRYPAQAGWVFDPFPGSNSEYLGSHDNGLRTRKYVAKGSGLTIPIQFSYLILYNLIQSIQGLHLKTSNLLSLQ